MSVCDLGAVHFKYILTVIDVLSKFEWVEPNKRKTVDNFVKAFEKILRKVRKPETFSTDKGTEFIKKQFQKRKVLEDGVSTISLDI